MCRRRPSTRMIVIATCTLLAFSSSIVHTFADELQQLNQVRRHDANRRDSRDGSRIGYVKTKVSSFDDDTHTHHAEEDNINEYYTQDKLLRMSKDWSTTQGISRQLSKYKRRRPHRGRKSTKSGKGYKPSQAPSTSSQPSTVPTTSYVPTVQSSTVPSTSTQPSSQPSSQPSDVPSTSVSPTIDPLRSSSSSKSSKKSRRRI